MSFGNSKSRIPGQSPIYKIITKVIMVKDSKFRYDVQNSRRVVSFPSITNFCCIAAKEDHANFPQACFWQSFKHLVVTFTFPTGEINLIFIDRCKIIYCAIKSCEFLYFLLPKIISDEISQWQFLLFYCKCFRFFLYYIQLFCGNIVSLIMVADS